MQKAYKMCSTEEEINKLTAQESAGVIEYAMNIAQMKHAIKNPAVVKAVPWKLG